MLWPARWISNEPWKFIRFQVARRDTTIQRHDARRDMHTNAVKPTVPPLCNAMTPAITPLSNAATPNVTPAAPLLSSI